jgi:hypothetical protein
MEDEHQSTLKKKIQILFQLGKWPDVVKLCDSYVEKYGKDMDIDMIRFKSERHMGIPAPPPKPAEEGVPPVPGKEEPPLVLSTMDAAIEMPAPPESGPSNDGAEAPVLEENLADAQPEAVQGDMFGRDPFEEDELIITDPFAMDEPGLNLAPDSPPVDVDGFGTAAEDEVPHIAALEMEGPADVPPAPPGEENEIDFKDIGAMTLDADPELMTTAHEAPAVFVPPAGKEAELEESFRAAAGGVDGVAEPEKERPTVFARTGAEEKPLRPGEPFPAKDEKKVAPRKKFFNLKLALLIILPLLAAVGLWLALSGKLEFSGTEEPAVSPEPVAERPVRRPPPKNKVSPAVVAPQVDEQEKVFNEKFQQADELYRKGDLLKAWAVLLEAKKIKSTEPLRLLEELLTNKMLAEKEQANQQSQVAQNQWQLETQAFDRATAENTLSSWQNFLKAFPQGEFAARAENKVALLEKKAQELADQQLLLKIQQAQKIRPRAAYLGLSQADISAMLSRSGKPPTQFEAYERGGVKMLLDYASGLMWTLWNKPMAYEKAKWWANRVTAGYGGWRLPTAEEAVSLLQANRDLYSGLADFSVWTGDTVSDQSRTAWVLKIPGGQFVAESYTQACYVWAVRKAGK